jgi:hypothetical protein
MDEQGLIPESFEAACKSLPVGALYLCPNLHNLTTATLPIRRREQPADIALRHSIPIIEDNADGILPAAAPPLLIELASELTHHVSGLSKWLGAGVRTAHVLAPTSATHQRLAGALRATTVIASPFVNHVVSDWIERGHCGNVLVAVREECSGAARPFARIWQARASRPIRAAFIRGCLCRQKTMATAWRPAWQSACEAWALPRSQAAPSPPTATRPRDRACAWTGAQPGTIAAGRFGPW